MNRPSIIGADIGKSADPTALAVVELDLRPIETGILAGRTEWHFVVRFLDRLPLGTSYTLVRERIVRLCQHVIEKTGLRPILRIDATGVGLPVVDELRSSSLHALRVEGVIFTGGDVLKQNGPTKLVLGKARMVSRLQCLLSSGRVHLPNTHEAKVLAAELRNFEIRVDEEGRQRSGAFKVGSHDDLITALGLAVLAEPAGVE